MVSRKHYYHSIQRQSRCKDHNYVLDTINVAGMDLPMVIHGVQHVFHPPEILDKWPDGDRSTRVVIIARDFDQEQIAACFNGFGLPVDKVADA